MSRPLHRKSTRALVLVLVLWALFVLSLVIFGLAQRINEEMFASSRENRAQEASALAYCGTQIALHPQATNATPAMRHTVDSRHRYAARIFGEGGKINLNWLLTGEDPRKVALLKAYLDLRGATVDDRDGFVDCLLDWVGPGNTTHLNGSATGIDGTPVPHRPLQDLSEIKRIRGNQVLTSLPYWQDDFTLLSKGPIDLQWASENVIGSLPMIGQLRARAFIQQRRGPDGLDGTADDVPLQTPAFACQLLGLSPTDVQAIQDLVVINDTTVRIQSAGQSGDVTRTI